MGRKHLANPHATFKVINVFRKVKSNDLHLVKFINRDSITVIVKVTYDSEVTSVRMAQLVYRYNASLRSLDYCTQSTSTVRLRAGYIM